MPIAVTCPGCQANFKVPDEFAGRKFRCKKCQELVTIAAEPEATVSEPVEDESEAPIVNDVEPSTSETDDAPPKKKPAKKGLRKKKKRFPVRLVITLGSILIAVLVGGFLILKVLHWTGHLGKVPGFLQRFSGAGTYETMHQENQEMAKTLLVAYENALAKPDKNGLLALVDLNWKQAERYREFSGQVKKSPPTDAEREKLKAEIFARMKAVFERIDDKKGPPPGPTVEEAWKAAGKRSELLSKHLSDAEFKTFIEAEQDRVAASNEFSKLFSEEILVFTPDDLVKPFQEDPARAIKVFAGKNEKVLAVIVDPKPGEPGVFILKGGGHWHVHCRFDPGVTPPKAGTTVKINGLVRVKEADKVVLLDACTIVGK